MVERSGAEEITAALIVIGDEILSGRTKDQNIGYIASHLTRVGISLREVRVIPDRKEAIIATVNKLRRRFTYVFSTGGIGPTHDDITTDAIGEAFGVAVAVDPRAVEEMRKGYRGGELSEARLRMARIPQGAEIVVNPVSRAPGFMLENVIVMAGIPRVMQVMLDSVTPRLRTGSPTLTRSVRVEVPEGDLAPGLALLQERHRDIQIGSYPFFQKDRLGTYVVLRTSSPDRLAEVHRALWSLLHEQGFGSRAADEEVEDEAGPS